MSKFKDTVEAHVAELSDVLSDNIDPHHEVNNMWAVVAISNEGGEGMPAMYRDGVAIPLMTTDINNVPKLKQFVRENLKEQPGIKKVVLRHFSNPVDEEL